MRKIYTNAVLVTAYLGELFPGLNLAVKYPTMAGVEPVFRTGNAMNPRDNIHTLLSLFTALEDVIKPDYTKTTEVSFQESTLVWTKNEHNLRLLSYVATRPHERSGLSTWAVDQSQWPVSQPRRSIEHKRSVRHHKFVCSTPAWGLSPFWKLKPPNTVTVNGFDPRHYCQ